jgi:hypothetical protein
LGRAARVLKVERLVGKRAGPLLDIELPTMTVVAGNDLSKALL